MVLDEEWSLGLFSTVIVLLKVITQIRWSDTHNRPFQMWAWSCITSYPLRGLLYLVYDNVNPAMVNSMMLRSSMLAFEKVYTLIHITQFWNIFGPWLGSYVGNLKDWQSTCTVHTKKPAGGGGPALMWRCCSHLRSASQAPNKSELPWWMQDRTIVWLPSTRE